MQENPTKKIIITSVLVLVLIGLIMYLQSNKTVSYKPPAVSQNSTPIKHNFTGSESPTFTFPNVAYASDLKNKTQIIDSNGNKIEANLTVTKKGEGSVVSLNQANAIRPGKYTLVIDENGRKITQDFVWGVLAINASKSVYLPGETAALDLAVLDEKGNMVCDADVSLKITNPLGKASSASVKNGQIAVNPECHQKKFTVNPDYETNFKLVAGVGKYQMDLTAVTKNGTYSITDFLYVQNIVDFEVERQTATRIFPYSTYPVLINIKANKDFSGQIVEAVPDSFKITPLANVINYSKIETSDKTEAIIWNINIKSGQTITIGYNFNAPLISPQFFLLGPLQFLENQIPVFSEKRQWQLAIDGVCTTYRSDNFNRGDQSNFGTSSGGDVWTTYPRTSILSNKGRSALTASTETSPRLGSAFAADFDAKITLQFSSHSPDFDAEVRGRFNEIDDWVRGGIGGATGDVFIQQRTGGVSTVIGNSSGALAPLSDGTDYYIRFQAEGTTVRLKAWKTTDSEPASWTTTATTSVTGSGTIGVTVFKSGTINFDWDDFTVTDLDPACSLGDFYFQGVRMQGIKIN